MAQTMILELPGNTKVLFGGGEDAGLVEVSVADDVARFAENQVKAALGSLAALVGTLQDSVARMDNRPEKIEMEFGASLTSACDLWIVSGDGKAEFKVKLTWGK